MQIRKGIILIILGVGFVVGCDEIFYEEDISNESILLNAPANNSSLTEGDISFHWSIINDASDYRLQIASPNFVSADKILLDTLISSNSFVQALDVNTFQWRVKGINSGYETDYTTHELELTKSSVFADEKVSLILPVADFNSNQTKHSLQWEAVENATEYRLQIWKPTTDGVKVKDTITTDLKKDIVLEDGTYLWQVNATNGSENTDYSFRSILIDTTNPSKPILSSPEHESTKTVGDVVFSWQRQSGEGSAEFDSIYVYTDDALTNLKFKEKSSTKTLTKSLENQTYYWKVQGFDAAGNKGEISWLFKLTVE